MHDFRHRFAVLQLSAGVQLIQVSKWLGHASYVITLTVSADYIPEEPQRIRCQTRVRLRASTPATW